MHRTVVKQVHWIGHPFKSKFDWDELNNEKHPTLGPQQKSAMLININHFLQCSLHIITLAADTFNGQFLPYLLGTSSFSSQASSRIFVLTPISLPTSDSSLPLFLNNCLTSCLPKTVWFLSNFSFSWVVSIHPSTESHTRIQTPQKLSDYSSSVARNYSWIKCTAV